MSDFFPKEFEDIPAGATNYMKLEEGANTFRVLSSAVIGYLYWTDKDGKRVPVRVRDIDDVPEKFLNSKDNRQNAKYFWAFAVYNTKTKSIQILEIKQKKVMRLMKSIIESEDWGDPKEYNINITRTKTGPEARDVEYSVMPTPKKDLDPEVQKLYDDLDVDLSQLFKGGDPFAKKEEKDEDEVNIDDIPENLGKEK